MIKGRLLFFTSKKASPTRVVFLLVEPKFSLYVSLLPAFNHTTVLSGKISFVLEPGGEDISLYFFACDVSARDLWLLLNHIQPAAKKIRTAIKDKAKNFLCV